MEGKIYMSKKMYEKIIEKEMDGFVKLTGIGNVEVDEGYAKGEIEIKPVHLNPIGTVHGGVLFTLADTIGGLASISRGGFSTTVSSDIVYLNPTMNSKKLIAESTEIKHGKRMSTIDTMIYDDNGSKIAKVTGVFYYLKEDGKAV